MTVGRASSLRCTRGGNSLAVIVILAMCTSFLFASDSPTVIEQLSDEAAQAKDTLEIADAPDFAARFDGNPEELDLANSILTRADSDPFIDAYIRWQLTSFEPSLQPNDREMTRLLQTLPRLIENPRATKQALELLSTAEAAESLSESDAAQLQQFVQEMDEQTELAQRFNQPATQLRAWLLDEIDPDGPRSMQLLIESCAATIEAGWSTRAVKTRITRACTAAAESENFTAADKRMIAQQLHRLAGRSRRSVDQVTFLANGSVNVSHSTAAVSGADVKRWIARLAGSE